MALGGEQQIGELAEHMRANRLALISAGHHDADGVDTEMI